jgi:hypothetical protein
MRVANLFIAGILAVIFIQSWASPVQAASSSATVHVQATIRPWLKFSATQPTSSYKVTAEDIRRGHIDLPQALTISMQTNVREEISFDVSSQGPERLMVLDGDSLADAVRLAGTHPSIPVTRSLDMRIVLPPNALEGTYPLHVALAPVAY